MKLALVTLLAMASSLAIQSPETTYEDVLISGVPHVKQQPDFCGEACAEMFLRKLGEDVSQDAVFGVSGVDPALGRGAYTNELARALARLGFEVGPVWHSVPWSQRTEQVERVWKELHRDLLRGVPSIVCMHYSDAPETTEHFRLVLGYDAARDEVVFHEPAEDDGAYRRMGRQLFLKLWTFHPAPERGTLIRLRLDPKRVEAPRPESAPTAAELAQHVMALKRRLAGSGYTIAVERPFVVLGDEAPATVRRRAADTVRWTIELLKKDFFPRDPEEITDVWILRDKGSYERTAWREFRDRPSTPYGYYSSANRAMVMNIGPGAGTLVHELVHPYVRANFPNCPAWLNEGLASLYERPGEVKGHLYGYPNWRLPGLQAALRRGRVPSLRSLTATTDAEFYEDDDGTHYAQARYLAYYLQEKGLLVEYVRRFMANQAQDPTGHATLQAVLQEPDMAEFEQRWRAFVLRLEVR